jgi:hypothetical protein
MEQPNVERCLESQARQKEIDLPVSPGQRIVLVSHENLLPERHMTLFWKLRFRLFPAPGITPHLPRLSSRRRGLAILRDHAGQGAVRRHRSGASRCRRSAHPTGPGLELNGVRTASISFCTKAVLPQGSHIANT